MSSLCWQHRATAALLSPAVRCHGASQLPMPPINLTMLHLLKTSVHIRR
jgi:hypothetical protein